MYHQTVHQTVHMTLLTLSFVAYSCAVPLVIAGSNLEARASAIRVSFMDYDRTAHTAGIKGFSKPEDDFVKKRVREFLTHHWVREMLGFSEVPTISFTNSFPYNTVAADSGMHFKIVGGPKCLSPCTAVTGKDTNSVGKNEPYGVIYNAQETVIFKAESDVAIVSFVQPTLPETFDKMVDGLAKSTIKRFFEHPQVAKALRLTTPVVSFEDAYTHTTIRKGGFISFVLYSGAGCTLKSPCVGQVGIDQEEPTLPVFFGKVENAHGHILVQVGEPIHGSRELLSLGRCWSNLS